MPLDDQQLLRYSRHILLPHLGIEGQEKLLAGRVLVVGVGGLGSPVALYLAAAGVGSLTLCDGDRVDLTNLQRQIAHHTAAVGQNKAESGRARALALNPEVGVAALPEKLAGNRIPELVDAADVVVDASDNFATRHALNRACFALGKPLVSGAALVYDGQVSVFDPRRADSPCYHCLYAEQGEADDQRCATFGVFSPLVGVIGSIQAAEALKLIAGLGSPLVGRLLLLDALHARFREVKLTKDPACPVCAASTAATAVPIPPTAAA
jgi:molybdopterin-synthase adenylyltransferase